MISRGVDGQSTPINSIVFWVSIRLMREWLVNSPLIRCAVKWFLSRGTNMRGRSDHLRAFYLLGVS